MTHFFIFMTHHVLSHRVTELVISTSRFSFKAIVVNSSTYLIQRILQASRMFIYILTTFLR